MILFERLDALTRIYGLGVIKPLGVTPSSIMMAYYLYPMSKACDPSTCQTHDEIQLSQTLSIPWLDLGSGACLGGDLNGTDGYGWSHDLTKLTNVAGWLDGVYDSD